MTKNVTLRLDENLLIKAKHVAVEKGTSLSQWMTDLLKATINKENDFGKARKRAITHLKKGYRLGGKSIKREDLYDRPSMLR